MSSSTTTSSTSTDSSPTSSSSSSDGDNRPRENNNGGGQVAPLAKNPSLQFEKPDHEYIPLPNVRDERTRNRLLRVFLLDRTRYPERRHRMLDYFRASVEMFVHQVVVENVEQSASAAKHGRQHTRFIWKNKGELAICFACCCDMLKLFYDTIQPSPIKPVWDAFVKQFAQFAIEESKIPTSILDEKTYNIKYLDWQKGGTRYVGESASNVRFPSVQERRVKVETYLRSGEGYTLQAVQVAVSDTVSVVPRAPLNTTAPPSLGGAGEVKSAQAPLSSAVVQQKVMPSRPKNISTAASLAQMPEELRHLYWLAALGRVKGNDQSVGFPDDRAGSLLGFVRLFDITDKSEEMTTLLKIINASSEYIQLLFASYGGVVRMRLLVAKCIQQKNYTTLAAVVESTANLKITSWDTPTQDAWKTNTEQRLTADLTWLKQLSFLPAGKEAVFRAMLGLIEQRYIFVKPCSSTHPYFKRPRDPSDVVREDNLDFQKWKVARVNTLGATRLPYALRASAFTSHLEGEVVEYLNIKVEYAEQTQANWKMRIEKMVADQSMSPGAVSVPVFHDPYELLNIGVDHKN